ncbi:hypothetical protein J8273_8834 [Carpediemonas membranifera]|uniref:IgGFc-binding protein N-terminal domain-containing protein n=1 Tax=Carpediemonas membranifera TaxID=201153 RepID=A0A8J6BTN6_9EUKA|nr:hypothetical protein J8273_8834 [Carpediemonas membranifera]|eukprot:KAG9389541.1 hypothetical protein J8273_8834 [Carpediemonas membranifera]
MTMKLLLFFAIVYAVYCMTPQTVGTLTKASADGEYLPFSMVGDAELIPISVAHYETAQDPSVKVYVYSKEADLWSLSDKIVSDEYRFLLPFMLSENNLIVVAAPSFTSAKSGAILNFVRSGTKLTPAGKLPVSSDEEFYATGMNDHQIITVGKHGAVREWFINGTEIIPGALSSIMVTEPTSVGIMTEDAIIVTKDDENTAILATKVNGVWKESQRISVPPEFELPGTHASGHGHALFSRVDGEKKTNPSIVVFELYCGALNHFKVDLTEDMLGFDPKLINDIQARVMDANTFEVAFTTVDLNSNVSSYGKFILVKDGNWVVKSVDRAANLPVGVEIAGSSVGRDGGLIEVTMIGRRYEKDVLYFVE